jgi:hypothetical protein
MIVLTMRKYLMAVPVLASALALSGAVPAPAAAASSSTTHGIAATQARFGGGFRVGRPSYGSRYRSPRYGSRYGRPHPFRGLGGSILRALGIAYLFHLFFGWGGGGSPLGLLLIAGLIVWLVTRSRRRGRRYAY